MGGPKLVSAGGRVPGLPAGLHSGRFWPESVAYLGQVATQTAGAVTLTLDPYNYKGLFT